MLHDAGALYSFEVVPFVTKNLTVADAEPPLKVVDTGLTYESASVLKVWVQLTPPAGTADFALAEKVLNSVMSPLVAVILETPYNH